MVMVLVVGMFLSALGLALLSLTATLLTQARSSGEVTRARALAQGSVAFGLRDLQDADRVSRRGIIAHGSVLYADGTRGSFQVEYDMDLKLIRSTGRIGDARSTFVSRFEHY